MKEFLRWLTTSRYTRRLEDDNERLAAENQRLLGLLLPRGYRGILPTSGAETSRSLDDQQAHQNRGQANTNANVHKFKRTNWTEARNKLEVLTDTSIQTEQRMQKAVNAHANL